MHVCLHLVGMKRAIVGGGPIAPTVVLISALAVGFMPLEVGHILHPLGLKLQKNARKLGGVTTASVYTAAGIGMLPLSKATI